MSGTSHNTLVLGRQAEVRDYIRLLKPRVMSLVVFTGFAGMMVAPGDIHPFKALLVVMALALASGAAGCLNMWYERHSDGLMRRTAGRPLPRGVIAPSSALEFGVVVALAAVTTMALGVGYIPAAWLGMTIGYYVFIYTLWLKPRTSQNIVIGGAAGAFPPVIGWVAVTGGASLEAWALFAIIFVWTPVHFWALALYTSEDYARARIPMLPVVHGDKATRRGILFYGLLLLPVSLAPVLLGTVGELYGVCALGLGGLLLVCVWRVFHERQGHVQARRLFKVSIGYLFLLFAALMADTMVGHV